MIPKSVWKDNKLYQPEILTTVYREKLEALDVLQQAIDFDPKQSKGAIGGQNEAETITHFIEKFLASVARVQFVVLDPHKALKDISNDVKATFGSGNIAFLDVPCGAGAGILSLLCNIREMRAHKLLPCLPLHVSITAGDYSETALQIYADLLLRIKPDLEEVNIFIDYLTHDWNAKSVQSTDKIMNCFLKQESEEYYVFISAFSGEAAKNFEDYKQTISYVQARVSNLNSCILHIEPNSNDATKFFQKLINLFAEKFMGKEKKSEGKSNKEGFFWIHSLNSKVITGGCSVKLFKRYG
jgi:hypothetical protein